MSRTVTPAPDVAVALPCYNGSAWLARALESVRREVRHFAFHARILRGISLLERDRPHEALREFLHAARACPLRANNLSLLLKALWRSIEAGARHPRFPARRAIP